MSKRRLWTPEEDAVLRALPTPVVRVSAVEAMAAAGFERTPAAIVAHLDALGIQRAERPEAWTPAEDAALMALLDTGLSPYSEDIVPALAAVGVVRSFYSIKSRSYRLEHECNDKKRLEYKAVPAVAPTDRSARIARDFALINTVLGRVFVADDRPADASA